MPREWLIQHRAGTLAEWAAAEASGPALLAGELRRTPPLVRAILDIMIDRVNETNEALMDLDSGARP